MKKIVTGIAFSFTMLLIVSTGNAGELRMSKAEKAVNKTCKKSFKGKDCKSLMSLLKKDVEAKTLGSYRVQIKEAQTRGAEFCAAGKNYQVLCRAYTLTAEAIKTEQYSIVYYFLGLLAVVACLAGLYFLGLIIVRKAKESETSILETKIFKKIVVGVIVGVTCSVVLYIFAIPKVNAVGALGFCVTLVVSVFSG